MFWIIKKIIIIIIIIQNIDQLTALQNSFESNSVLKFTYELSNNNKINFLDVDVNITPQTINSSVHIKPTNSGVLLNYNSECPQRY